MLDIELCVSVKEESYSLCLLVLTYVPPTLYMLYLILYNSFANFLCMKREDKDFDSLFSNGLGSKVDSRASESILETSVLRDDFDFEPSVENSFGEFGDFQLVGHGKVTNDNCGKFRSFYGCSRIGLHNRITLDGQSFSGKVFMKSVFYSCDKPSCPKCYLGGWTVRQARNITNRLAEASKRFGQVEHIIATIPPKFYGLSLEALRAKIDKILFDRGVIGGVKIFHGFRYNFRKHWYWSPHFHVLGFILGGYKCRNCAKVRKTGKCGIENRNCDGFVNRNYRMYEKDGCIVKVKGKRKSVYHTAFYQLNHSSVKKGVRRFQVATWFGVVSYRKMKVTVEKRKSLCPICRHELEEHFYLGRKVDILVVLRSDRISCSKRRFFADYLEDGQPAWIVVERRKWSSGSYEE